MRIGIGYDVHKFKSGRDLILGGVKIDYELGLDGHSDADVLLHAICDALLGAAALGDIGKLYPDNDDRFKGADSRLLLKDTYDRLKLCGYRLVNLDCIIIAQRPKMSPHIDLMRKIIADTLGADISQISVKATTEEGLGFTGAMQGIAAKAAVLIE